MHVLQEKELPAVSVWGGAQAAQAMCVLLGLALSMGKLVRKSLRALHRSPKAHDSVPPVCTCPSDCASYAWVHDSAMPPFT